MSTHGCAAGSAARNVLKLVVAAAIASGIVAGCGSGASSSSDGGSRAARWVDQPVSFAAGGVTIEGTYRHPVGSPKKVPAVLLIAGSGPTDRNGNSAALPGKVDTLQMLADWLSAEGVASLRYDKLGTGETGLGPYGSDPSAIGLAPYEQEATAAARFLARQPGVDTRRLGVIGHSEGALFALLLASGALRPAPPVHAVGLLEPLSLRSLDLLAVQTQTQMTAARTAGQISASQRAEVERLVASTIASLRATGTLPADLPSGLAGVLPASSARFLSQIDRYDPSAVAADLPAGTPVLVTCSDADVQVTCGEVQHVIAGLKRAHANTDLIALHGVDHVLKQDPSRSPSNYTAPLPFSSQLRGALRTFVNRNL